MMKQKLHTRFNYVVRVYNPKAKAKPSRTVPDQALTIKEILARFTRGIPVADVQKKPIYSDQTEFDLEKVANATFDDKAALAAELAERNEAAYADIKTAQAEAKEAKDKLAKDQADEAHAKAVKEAGEKKA